MDCIFCKIVNGEIPSDKVYEDEFVLAFNDIQPAAPVHVLVIPKKHIACAKDIQKEDEALIGKMFTVINQIANELKLDNGFRIINFNNVSCYIEGYKNILDFSPECISIKLFKGIIKLCGKDLKIKNLNLNTVLIVGQINSVEQN